MDHKFFEDIRGFEDLLAGRLSRKEAQAVLDKAERKVQKFAKAAMEFIEGRRALLAREEQEIPVGVTI